MREGTIQRKCARSSACGPITANSAQNLLAKPSDARKASGTRTNININSRRTERQAGGFTKKQFGGRNAGLLEHRGSGTSDLGMTDADAGAGATPRRESLGVGVKCTFPYWYGYIGPQLIIPRSE